MASVRYVLGVDGGGTKTHCALFTLGGVCIDFLTWGSSNHELLPGGFAAFRVTLTQMLETLRARNDLDWSQVEAVFGLAGVDSRAQEKMVLEILAGLGFTRAHVCNDSYLGIQAGSPKPWGICTLNGTGTGSSGLDPAGKTCHRGGLWALTGDYGGGHVLGGEVVRCVYDMLYRQGPATCLEELLLRELGLTYTDGDSEQLLEAVLQGATDQSIQVKRYAPLLFEAACRDDVVALGVLQRSGQACARDICDVLRCLTFPADEEIPVVLIGSLYTKANHPALRKSMQAALQPQNPMYRFAFTVLNRPPVLGAIRWATERGGGSFDIESAAQQIDLALA